MDFDGTQLQRSRRSQSHSKRSACRYGKELILHDKRKRILSRIMVLESMLLSTIVSFVAAQFTGFLFYGPLFGNIYLRALKDEKPELKMEDGKNAILISLIMWIISSIMFSTLVSMTGFKDFFDLVKLAVTVWLGFSVPSILFTVIFEHRSKIVAGISAGYLLTASILMAMSHWLF
jgi:hypothetical protein